MLANELKKLYQATPGVLVAGESLDDLVEDTQAAVIRYLREEPGLLPYQETTSVPEQPTLAPMVSIFVEALEHEITDILNTEFGATLFNLVTNSIHARFFYSARKRVVKAMILAMVLAGSKETPRNPALPLR